MNSKERVLTAAAHRRPDRIPFDYWARQDVTVNLMNYLQVDSQEALLRRLNIDLRHISILEHHPEFERRKDIGILNGNSESSGKKFKLHPDGCFEDAWGVIKRLGSDGLYEEWMGGPLVDNPDIDSFAWPALDSFDSVPVIRERVSAFENRYALLGRINLPFKVCWHLRGLENFICDMLTDPEYARKMIERVAAYELEKGLRLIQAGVDIIGVYGDIAMQDRMLVHTDAWRECEKPVLEAMIRKFKEANPKILAFYHSDGDISEVMPDLIEIGIDIVNPIQPECMNPTEVKKKYGSRVTMHGTLSIQKTLPRGTVEDVIREVAERISTCGRNGGLIVCPSNMLQNDTPLENIVALYETDRTGP